MFLTARRPFPISVVTSTSAKNNTNPLPVPTFWLSDFLGSRPCGERKHGSLVCLSVFLGNGKKLCDQKYRSLTTYIGLKQCIVLRRRIVIRRACFEAVFSGIQANVGHSGLVVHVTDALQSRRLFSVVPHSFKALLCRINAIFQPPNHGEQRRDWSPLNASSPLSQFCGTLCSVFGAQTHLDKFPLNKGGLKIVKSRHCWAKIHLCKRVKCL
ncbi:hypothetical protein EDD85DRAFT_787972 [Armillaria nabsnona]|nr:hypothetical protein EDD85DRAFT_787972 [Armillaria nabsnona]